jgi:hypothetical protein
MGEIPMNLPLLTYAFAIVFGALVIFFPGGIHICIACGWWLETVFGAVSIILGIAGIATRGQTAAAR